MATYITIETDKKIAYQIDGGEKNVMFANVEDDGYPEPTGTITITQNGTGIDVKDYAEADVNVPGGGYPEPTGTITITQNGTGIDVKDYAAADVAVPSYPEPTGTKQISITQNGTTTENVKDYASAEITVNVPAEQYYIKTGSFTIDSDIAVTTSGNDIDVGFTGQPDMIYCWMTPTTFNNLETVSSNVWYRWAIIKNDSIVPSFPPVRINASTDVQGHFTSDIDYIIAATISVNTSTDPTNSKGYALNPMGYSTYNSAVNAINNDGTITIARFSTVGQTVKTGTYNYIALYGLSYLPV